jgi:hypothetical protein
VLSQLIEDAEYGELLAWRTVCIVAVVVGGPCDDVVMDPVTVVVAAIAGGAATGLNQTVAQAVRDAYAALKGLIARKYGDVDVSAVEKKPDSAPKRDSLAEDLAEAGAGDDMELVGAARALIEAVRAHAADAGAVIGVDLQQVEAEALRIGRVWASGTGVRVRDARFHGDIDINEVVAVDKGPPNPSGARQ